MKRVLLVAALALTACVSSGGRATRVATCADDPALRGSWRSYRLSQLGPAWINITFDCGCVYRSTAQLVFSRVKEEGNYRVEGGVVVFTRANGRETRMPYRLE